MESAKKSTHNVGVVGCGYWGPNLIRNFSALNTCRVKTVCDMSQARLDHMSSLYRSVTTTQSFDDMLADDDIERHSRSNSCQLALRPGKKEPACGQAYIHRKAHGIIHCAVR